MSTLGYVGSTLEYMWSTLSYVGYVGCTLGFVGNTLPCIAFAIIVVNIESVFGALVRSLSGILTPLWGIREYFRVY